MNSLKLRDPYEIPLYIVSVLANLLIIALILVGHCCLDTSTLWRGSLYLALWSM